MFAASINLIGQKKIPKCASLVCMTGSCMRPNISDLHPSLKRYVNQYSSGFFRISGQKFTIAICQHRAIYGMEL